MKNIEDYKHTNTQIIVRTEEDYHRLVPLLNTIFAGWNSVRYNSYKNKDGVFFVDLNHDQVYDNHRQDTNLLEVSDFFETYVINNYSLY